MPEAIVAGHICLDIIPELHGALGFVPGSLVQAGPAALSTGGAVSNTGLALAKLGVDVRLMGKVGDDLFGRAIRELLGPLGEGMIVTPGEPTSYTVVVNLTGQDRMFLHAPGCNDTFTAEDVDFEPSPLVGEGTVRNVPVTGRGLSGASDAGVPPLPSPPPRGGRESTGVFHFGYPTLMARMFADDGEELVRLFQSVKGAGWTSSLDMSLPDPNSPAGKANWRRILERTLPYVDIFTPNRQELEFMLGELSPLDLGAKVLLVKDGANGLHARSREGLAHWSPFEVKVPCFEVHVAGTTGAGDACTAGFLYGFLRGKSPEESAAIAAAMGACCCEKPDATSGLPSEERLFERLWAWRQATV